MIWLETLKLKLKNQRNVCACIANNIAFCNRCSKCLCLYECSLAFDVMQKFSFTMHKKQFTTTKTDWTIFIRELTWEFVCYCISRKMSYELREREKQWQIAYRWRSAIYIQKLTDRFFLIRSRQTWFMKSYKICEIDCDNNGSHNSICNSMPCMSYWNISIAPQIFTLSLTEIHKFYCIIFR